MDDKERIISETETYQEPRTVTEKRTVQEPKTVMEKQTIEVPKTVMEEREIEEQKTVMETRYRERPVSLSCQSLRGVGVTNEQGEDLGEITDVMIDLDTWKVSYAVLSFRSGFLSSDKLFAIPPEAFSIRESDRDSFYREGMEHKVVLNIPRDAFKESEGFDKDNWPRQPDRSWLNSLYDRYGLTPPWRRSGMHSETRSEIHTEGHSDIPK